MKFLDDEQLIRILDICKLICLILIVLILSIILFKIYNFRFEKEDCLVNYEPLVNNDSIEEVAKLDENITILKDYAVDIKGAVLNPGVYIVAVGSKINDVINLAGGLKSNASTKYINLSKSVSDEMVINIYTNYEISQMDKEPSFECVTSSVTLNECKESSVIISSNNVTNEEGMEINGENVIQDVSFGKISINKGTKEQLMSLAGIGEAKAIAIITYREEHDGFKTLEEIKNVSGIGDAAYEKIKDSIEL